MTFEEDFIVKEKSQTLESQFLLWDIGNPSHGGNSTEKTVKKKKMKREEASTTAAQRISSETLPWYVTNHRGEPPMVPHLVAGGLRPRSPPPTPHSANTLPINAIIKFPVNFFLWTAGLWWSRPL